MHFIMRIATANITWIRRKLLDGLHKVNYSKSSSKIKKKISFIFLFF